MWQADPVPVHLCGLSQPTSLRWASAPAHAIHTCTQPPPVAMPNLTRLLACQAHPATQSCKRCDMKCNVCGARTAAGSTVAPLPASSSSGSALASSWAAAAPESSPSAFFFSLWVCFDGSGLGIRVPVSAGDGSGARKVGSVGAQSGEEMTSSSFVLSAHEQRGCAQQAKETVQRRCAA